MRVFLLVTGGVYGLARFDGARRTERVGETLLINEAGFRHRIHLNTLDFKHFYRVIHVYLIFREN